MVAFRFLKIPKPSVSITERGLSTGYESTYVVPEGSPVTTAAPWDFKLAVRLAGETLPYSPSATARTPATKGVAMDVPEIVLVAVVLPIQAERTFTPSAR